MAAGTTLLFAWLGRLAGVPPEVLLSVGAAVAVLTWAAVLVTVPWNLYFGARRVAAEQALSRERDIAVRPERIAEARRIARWMLRFAVAGHVGTAVVAAVVAYVSGEQLGYYLAGFFLLSTLLRPASAYFSHLRHRITALERETAFPRDDVVTLKRQVEDLEAALSALREQTDARLRGVDDDLRRATADLAHVRTQVGTDLDRLIRRVDTTLDGVSDHRELLTGLRALVRMIRSE
ncbi:hypothetical protein GCM10009557_64060 [Virgisporangium ochraceum]